MLTALTGDATAAVAYGLEGARALGTLRYSRQVEEEADADGMRLMAAAGIDPAGMLGFMETLATESHGLPRRSSTCRRIRARRHGSPRCGRSSRR